MADPSAFSLDELFAVIQARGASTAERSYTKSLLDAGVHRVAKKFGEEAVEAVIAAIGQDDAALVSECADVIYHLLVLLRVRGLGFADVVSELSARTRRSGLEEKAARDPAATVR